MSDKSYRPSQSPAPLAEAETPSPAWGSNRVLSANAAPGGGNAFAASVAAGRGGPESSPRKEPGLFDKLGAVLGSSHVGTMLGSAGAGVEWDAVVRLAVCVLQRR